MPMPYGPDPDTGQTWRDRKHPKREVLVTRVGDDGSIVFVVQTDQRGVRQRDAVESWMSPERWARTYEWVSG